MDTSIKHKGLHNLQKPKADDNRLRLNVLKLMRKKRKRCKGKKLSKYSSNEWQILSVTIAIRSFQVKLSEERNK